MYEYIPTYSRKKERLTVFTLLSLAVVLLVVSRIEEIPFPALWQLAAVCVLTGMVTVLCRFWLRSYIYRVSPQEDNLSGTMDLIVVERLRGRDQVVCRVSVSDIESITPITPSIKSELRKKRRGSRVWLYYAELSAPNLYQLTVRDDDDVFFLLIQSDQTLISVLKSTREQYLSSTHKILS